MRIGVQLPEVERPVPWAEQLAIARAAEEGGLDSVWVGDHLLYEDPRRGPWDAWTQLAALAAATERVTLGPLVACLAFHRPLVLARMAATVQAVSGGRLVLGVGAGWNDVEFVAAGLPTDKKVTRFESAFAELRHWLDEAPMPDGVPRIPLMTGSSGPRALSIVLPHVDSWNVWWADYGNTPEGFATFSQRVAHADVEKSACVLVSVDGGAGERPDPGVDPVPHDRLADHLAALAEAGADEAILVLDPITESSVRTVAANVAEPPT